MMPKGGFSLADVWRQVDWGQACSPSFIGQILPHSPSAWVVLLLAAAGAVVCVASWAQQRRRFVLCAALGLAAGLVGTLGTLAGLNAVRAVVAISEAAMKPEELRAGATEAVVPLVLGLVVLGANVLLGATTLAHRRPAPPPLPPAAS